MNGLLFLPWLIGLPFLALCVWFAHLVDSAPVEAGEYSHMDHLDGLPHGAAEHEARMDARAARLGMPR